MIIIPEYIFQDGSIKFRCPALEMSHDDAVQIHNVLTETRWPRVLGEEEYNIIRKAWCDHMRTYLSTALSQGD